jgi:hypothetical protein
MESISKTARRINSVRQSMEKEAIPAGANQAFDFGKKLIDDTLNYFADAPGKRQFMQNADGVGMRETAGQNVWNKIRRKADPSNISNESLKMTGLAGGAGAAGAGFGLAASEQDQDTEKNASNQKFFQRRI